MSEDIEAGGFPERLSQGYRAFLGDRFRREQERYEQQAEQQTPDTMVIGCCDSRVSPEVIFDAGPGELFVVRNVANLVPPYERDGDHHGTSAALEFAIQGLKVRHIVVLGHGRCGGVKAFADHDFAPLTEDDFIGRWVQIMAPAAIRAGSRGADPASYLRRLELASIEQSLANLLTFPCIRDLVLKGKLFLHGAFFAVATGELLVRNPETGAFEPVAESLAERSSLMRCE